MSKFAFFKRALILGLAILMGSSANILAAGPDYLAQPWTFNFGGGYSPVVGGLNSKIDDGWNLTFGAGYNFNEKTGLHLEYMNNHLGVRDGVLNQYSARLGAPTDGRVSVWSLTLNPTWRFHQSRYFESYVIGGGGYYHVNAQITTPGLAYQPPYCDPWWGCWGGGVVPADFIVAEHKDDTGGVNAGVGMNFFLGSSGVILYVEARYHYILTRGPDLSLLPMTVGLRF